VDGGQPAPNGGSGDADGGEAGGADAQVLNADGEVWSSYTEWAKTQKQPETKEEARRMADEMARVKAQDPSVVNAPIPMMYASTTLDSASLGRTAQLGKTVLPIPPENQQIALCQVAGPLYHIKRNTCSFRVLGVFPNQFRMLKHIKLLEQRFGDAIKGKLFSKPLNTPWMLGFDPEVDPAHPDYQATLQRILDAQNTFREKKIADFDQYSADRRTNRKGLQEEEFERFAARVEVDKKITDAVQKADKHARTMLKRKGASEPPEITPAESVRGQSHACFYCVHHPDDIHKPGPVGKWVVNILGAFPDESGAHHYVSDTLQHTFTPKGIKILSHEMYEWVDVERPRTLAMSSLNCRTVFTTQRHQDIYTGRAQSRAFTRELMRQQDADGVRRAKNPFGRTHPETRGGKVPSGTELLPAAMREYQAAQCSDDILFAGTAAKEDSGDDEYVSNAPVSAAAADAAKKEIAEEGGGASKADDE
jgi:hypothetical protein